MKGKISLSVLVVAFVVALYGTVALGAEQKTEVVKVEDQKMLFICYWELNENMSAMQHVGINDVAIA